jgi:hypothetical protein
LLRLIPLRGTQPRFETSWSEAFAVWQMVAVPAAQRVVAGVREKKFQRRRFHLPSQNATLDWAMVIQKREFARCA